MYILRSDSETVLHLFYECPFTNLIFKKFEDFWFTLSNEHEELLPRDVFIGKSRKNYFFILQNCMSGQVGIVPKVPSFLRMVDIKYLTENYMASKK